MGDAGMLPLTAKISFTVWTVMTIGDEEVAARVHRYTIGQRDPLARMVCLLGGVSAGSGVDKGHQRPDAGSLHVAVRQQIAGGIKELDAAIARAGRPGLEGHLHRAGVACIVGLVCRAGAAAGIGKVQVLGALRNHCRRTQRHSLRQT